MNIDRILNESWDRSVMHELICLPMAMTMNSKATNEISPTNVLTMFTRKCMKLLGAFYVTQKNLYEWKYVEKYRLRFMGWPQMNWPQMKNGNNATETKNGEKSVYSTHVFITLYMDAFIIEANSLSIPQVQSIFILKSQYRP